MKSVDIAVYNTLLEEFGDTSSWAIWSAPVSGNWKSKESVADMTPFCDDKKLLKQINGEYIFVGLNPAKHDHANHPILPWANFHSDDARRSQDYKLRYALRDTQYWGSFITDVYTGIVDTDSGSAMKKVTSSATSKSIQELLRIRNLLGGESVIVAMGGKAYSTLKKYLPADICLKQITHYSSYVNIDNYRTTVLNQLKQ